MGWSCCSVACVPNRPMRYGIQIAALAIRDKSVWGGRTPTRRCLQKVGKQVGQIVLEAVEPDTGHNLRRAH
jgi:hypothetical protein